MEQPGWVNPQFNDNNFAHCNSSTADQRDNDGHCHGSDNDSTYGERHTKPAEPMAWAIGARRSCTPGRHMRAHLTLDLGARLPHTTGTRACALSSAWLSMRVHAPTACRLVGTRSLVPWLRWHAALLL
eukprot:7352443-Prymnesium_polylepis.1